MAKPNERGNWWDKRAMAGQQFAVPGNNPDFNRQRTANLRESSRSAEKNNQFSKLLTYFSNVRENLAAYLDPTLELNFKDSYDLSAINLSESDLQILDGLLGLIQSMREKNQYTAAELKSFAKYIADHPELMKFTLGGALHPNEQVQAGVLKLLTGNPSQARDQMDLILSLLRPEASNQHEESQNPDQSNIGVQIREITNRAATRWREIFRVKTAPVAATMLLVACGANITNESRPIPTATAATEALPETDDAPTVEPTVVFTPEEPTPEPITVGGIQLTEDQMNHARQAYAHLLPLAQDKLPEAIFLGPEDKQETPYANQFGLKVVVSDGTLHFAFEELVDGQTRRYVVFGPEKEAQVIQVEAGNYLGLENNNWAIFDADNNPVKMIEWGVEEVSQDESLFTDENIQSILDDYVLPQVYRVFGASRSTGKHRGHINELLEKGADGLSASDAQFLQAVQLLHSHPLLQSHLSELSELIASQSGSESEQGEYRNSEGKVVVVFLDGNLELTHEGQLEFLSILLETINQLVQEEVERALPKGRTWVLDRMPINPDGSGPRGEITHYDSHSAMSEEDIIMVQKILNSEELLKEIHPLYQEIFYNPEGEPGFIERSTTYELNAGEWQLASVLSALDRQLLGRDIHHEAVNRVSPDIVRVRVIRTVPSPLLDSLRRAHFIPNGFSHGQATSQAFMHPKYYWFTRQEAGQTVLELFFLVGIDYGSSKPLDYFDTTSYPIKLLPNFASKLTHGSRWTDQDAPIEYRSRRRSNNEINTLINQLGQITWASLRELLPGIETRY